MAAAQQQPATMQQVAQPQEAPTVQIAPIQQVNQVTPQQVYAPQYQPLQFHGGYHGITQVDDEASQYQVVILHRMEALHGLSW